MMDLDDVKLVTHLQCSDGSACAVLFLAAGGNQKNIVFVPPGHTEVDEVAKDLYYNWEGEIWFVDVSVSVETAELLENRAKDIHLLDHHKSAIPLAKFSFCQIDEENSACGSKLFYQFLNRKGFRLSAYKEFIDNVDDMDRWSRSIFGSEVIFSLHSLYGQKLFIERFQSNPSMTVTPVERALIDIDLKKQKQYIKSKKDQVSIHTRTVQGKKVNVGFVNAGGPYRSALGDALCSDPDLGIDVVVMVNGDFISLRSRGDNVDCSRLAKMNGGGGHFGAGGCSLADVLGKDLLSLAIGNMKFE